MYRVKQEDCPFLFTHPAPSSLLAEEMEVKHKQGSHSALADEEDRKIDAVN